MAARRLLSLPIEVQARILFHLNKPLVPLVRSQVPRPRYHSSIALTPDLRPRSTPTASPASASLSEPAFFESPTSEYDQVPRSTLDYPSTPRTPDESLLSLLSSKQFPAALALLAELRSSDQPIPPRYLFALHAHVALKADPSDGRWLEWWKLAPGVIDPPHEDVINLRVADATMAKRAEKIVRKLLRAEQEGTGSDGGAFPAEQLREFALVLARQGHARVVAEAILQPMAAYGNVDDAEKVWETTLQELKRQSPLFVPQEAYLSYRSQVVKKDEMRMGRRERQRRAVRRVDVRTSSIRRWFAVRTQEAYKALLRGRERVIHAHAKLGRLDLAVSLLASTERQTGLAPNRAIRLSKDTYLTLLSLLASRNRFDLFEQVYASLELAGRRLTRIRNQNLRVRKPYFVRGASFNAPDAAPSAQEAFTTMRYQHAVSSIEEGAWEDDADAEYASAEYRRAGAEDESFGRSTSQAQSAKLLRLIEADQLDVAGSVLAELLTHGPLPSAHAAAVFVHAVEARRSSEDVLAVLDDHVRSASWRKGFWATARMLADLQRGEYKAAIVRFKHSFALTALPNVVARAVRTVTFRTERGQTARLLVPNAYTVAILLQALVPHLEKRAANSADLVDSIYASLFDANHWNIISPHAYCSAPTSSSSHHLTAPSRSPLDPYSLIPFLLSHHLHRHSPPETLLSILASMVIRLSLAPQPPHFAIVLNAYARRGSTVDLSFLLECVERRALPRDLDSSPLARQAGPHTVELAALIFPPAPSSSTTTENPIASLPSSALPLSVKVYTGLLSGLRRRGERKAALELLQGMIERDPARVQKWSRDDERFRWEVGLLGRASGLGPKSGGTAPGGGNEGVM
ncbi:hypothetical protein JCM1841_000497 [Sporobolomyces salmonicolor]